MSDASGSVSEGRRLFGQLLTPEFLNPLDGPEPSAVYTPYVVVWLLVYQRLHADASLADAVLVMERSELVAETLGERVFDFVLRNKRAEWEAYRAQVTPYELEQYLSVL